MKDDTQLNELGRAYRQLKAPRNLAPRILAAAEARASRKRAYGLPLAAAAAVAALMVVVPYLMLNKSDESNSLRPMHIPLSRVQGHIPGMSSFAPPNLADIQGLPALPSRHDMVRPETEEQPQSQLPASFSKPTLT